MPQKQSKPKTVRSEQRAREIIVARNSEPRQKRILIGTPTLGSVRIEWHNAMNGMIVPVNWSNSMLTPIGFQVADGQNIIAQQCVEHGFDWMLLVEDDVVVPPDLLLKVNRYIADPKTPVISGLYVLKSPVPTPFVFRGRGNGTFTNWKMGQKVWCDGVPTGCLLIHGSVIRKLWENSEEYVLRNNKQLTKVRRVFETPRYAFTDLHASTYQKLVGTSDLWFCDRILREDILKAAGWAKAARRKYPFLVDTTIHCGHVERDSGKIYYWPGENGARPIF